MPRSRWEQLVWPQWLPVRARLPLIAQILGVVTLTALLAGPFWSTIASPKPLPTSSHLPIAPHAPAIMPELRRPVARGGQSAHLNLDVRHSFGSVNFSVAVDGKRVFAATLTGSGKKFKMFGKRSERGFTKALELEPGAHVVQVRVTSPDDKFDQSRTERFDLDAASVAAMQIAADKSGLSIAVQRPAPAPAVAAGALVVAAPQPVPVPAPAPPPAPAPVTASSVASVDASVELLRTVRSMLIAIMGFIASAATGFVVQEFMRSRRGLLFDRRRKPRRGEAA